MKIQFIGAAHEVTGSCTLLTVCGKKFLVDCGMEQGRDIFENVPLPVAAGEIDGVFLTHAHIDHSGMLPKLYKDGFQGSVYATEATCDLCAIMLRDAAHIQESEAQWRNRKAERAGMPPVEPVYTLAHAESVLRRFRRCRYGQTLQISEGVTVRFSDIGHLLGSACVELWLTEENTTKKIVFSGDVGNLNQPLINDPLPVAETDYLVVESTYGNRLHEAPGDTIGELARILQETFDRGGNVVIPSFAVGRTQEMLYAIRQIHQQSLVTGHGDFPVYVDSPLAVEATGIFLQCDNSCFDPPTTELVRQGINPIWFPGVTLSVTADESKAINEDRRSKVILSASGMCEAGRIRHHLKHNLWSPKNTVLFVGYQAEGSLGRKLQDGAQQVRLFGEDIIVKAQIATLHGTSGHADQDGLLRWVESFQVGPKQIYVNHGDEDACEAFKALLTEKGYAAEAPYSGTEYDLLTGKMTVYTDGKRISKEQQVQKSNRASSVYADLVAAAEALLALAKACKGRTNKEISRFTAQIRSLIEKFK